MELRGLEDIDALLAQVAPKQARNIMRATVHQVAGEVRDDARDRAPSDGLPVRLKRAIRAKREKVVYGRIRSTVRVSRDAFYWRFHEYGTVKMPERPFFGPAVERLRATWTERYLQAFLNKFIAALARARKRQGL